MRKWYKYTIDYLSGESSSIYIKTRDSNFEQHSEAMGGYDADNAYMSKDAFYKKYFYGYHLGRLENYDHFLRLHIKKDDKILSVASGRCANELKLIENGYSIVCSDLRIPGCYEKTKALFPKFVFHEYDVLSGSTNQKYDGITSLRLIYLFDDKELSLFFQNVKNSLKPSGYLILDCPGPPDNILSSFYHDYFLRFEVTVLKTLVFIKSLGRRRFGTIKQHFGYRHSASDIIAFAHKHGFELRFHKSYAFLTEFSRSYVFKHLMRIPFSKPLFSCIGRLLPYTRMYLLSRASQSNDSI